MTEHLNGGSEDSSASPLQAKLYKLVRTGFSGCSANVIITGRNNGLHVSFVKQQIWKNDTPHYECAVVVLCSTNKM